MASQLSWSSGTCCKPQLRTLRSLNKWFRTMIISYLVYTSMCRYAHCISELGSVRCLVGTPISRIVVKMFQICPVEICQPCNTDTGYLHVAVIIAIIWIHRFFLVFRVQKRLVGSALVNQPVDSNGCRQWFWECPGGDTVRRLWDPSNLERNGEVLSYTIPYFWTLTKSNKILLRHLIFESLWRGRHTQVCACIVIVESYTCAKGFRTDWA